MNTEAESPANERTIWARGLYMLLFAFFLWVAKFVVGVLVIVQFFFVVFTGSSNEKLLTFGQSLSTYHYQVLQFLTFNSDEHPYPMAEWPKGIPVSDQEGQESLE